MTDVVNSGYKAEAQAVVFSGTRTLNALANDEWTDLSDAIDNSVSRYLYADFDIVLGSVVFAGADSALELYLVPAIDGTTYADWVGDGIVDEQQQNIHFIGAVTTSGASGAQKLALRKIELPPGLWKLGVRNRTNIALHATNTISWRPWQFSSV